MFCCMSKPAVSENNRPHDNQEQIDDVSIHFSQSAKDDSAEQPIYSGEVLDTVRIDWSELHFDTSKKDTILGYGMFGVVIKGVWIPKDTEERHNVAVKLFIQSANNFPEDEFMKMCCAAYDEIEVMKRAEKYIGSSEYIVKAHGLLMGSLPLALASVLDLHKDGLALSGVGIVMRNEGGSTLANLVYNRKKGAVFPLYEKLRILSLIAKGLSELHTAGIVHADIKPANILLTPDTPSKVRLADFGLSILKARNVNASIVKSTLAMTTQTQGTPVYYAPEMLFNPFEKPTPGTVPVIAKPSRKTDMYAFALLCWQTLTQKNLFPDITTESVLATMVHKGYRPPLEDLPPQTPHSVIEMIIACWEKDRSKRKSAAECHIILNMSLNEVPMSTLQEPIETFTPKRLKWTDIILDCQRPEFTVIGSGTFGVVIRGILKLNDSSSGSNSNSSANNTKGVECAIKVFTQEFTQEANITDEYQKLCKRAIQEAQLILRAERYFQQEKLHDNVIKCYGVIVDKMPTPLIKLLQSCHSYDCEYTGIGTVMRYEGGGSLSEVLFPSQYNPRPPMNLILKEKVRIILGIARALSGLHAMGIVHADLKLENVLLSSDIPPEVRIADFGSSLFGPRPNPNLGKSSLAMTTHVKGSPVYNAPEILYNPYEQHSTTAKPSRKTDMYAFALLSWEILSQADLFPDINSETVLASIVHQGTRPPLSQLPPDTPPIVIEMIIACWDKSRSKRKTAAQCVEILEQLIATMS